MHCEFETTWKMQNLPFKCYWDLPLKEQQCLTTAKLVHDLVPTKFVPSSIADSSSVSIGDFLVFNVGLNNNDILVVVKFGVVLVKVPNSSGLLTTIHWWDGPSALGSAILIDGGFVLALLGSIWGCQRREMISSGGKEGNSERSLCNKNKSWVKRWDLMWKNITIDCL